MMKFVEKIDCGYIRKMCIENNLCTKMDNEAYERMFNYIRSANRANDRVGEETIAVLANLIYKESEIYDEDMDIGHIACMIFQGCIVRWVEMEEYGKE